MAQLCSKGFKVVFINNNVLIRRGDEILFRGSSSNNIYTISLVDANNLKCLVTTTDFWLWHRRLGHCGIDLISKLASKKLV